MISSICIQICNGIGGSISLPFSRPRFLFDLLLVTLMIFETWVMAIVYAVTGGGGQIASGASVLRVARIMRVLRTARMARLVRLMPELMSPGRENHL